MATRGAPYLQAQVSITVTAPAENTPTVTRGTVVLVDLNPTIGHEQRGLRPCVVVSDEAVAVDQRFPLLCVVPVTATPGAGALYPTLLPGPSGLRKQSYALIDHLRSIDKQRVIQVHGPLSVDELGTIDRGLRLYLGLP
ncbi:MAG TPA: type II toxin-antitoxin system PemK/MazF family toxin [Gemmatimonadaceae bacterium]|nr:type II toxin-antitoxin system PemK/MazF family toxin [Gemmatimonadaceae bacterium]